MMSRKSRARRRTPPPPEDFRFSRKDAARIRQVMVLPQPCILCESSKTVCRALFVPSRPEVWGGTPGKRRVLVYRLCRTCLAKPDKALLVEARLMRRLVGQRN